MTIWQREHPRVSVAQRRSANYAVLLESKSATSAPLKGYLSSEIPNFGPGI